MSEESLCFYVGFGIGLFIGLIAALVIWKINNCEWRQDAIDAGVGYYDEKTAEFKFKVVEE